jgi:hypothetical protein
MDTNVDDVWMDMVELSQKPQNIPLAQITVPIVQQRLQQSIGTSPEELQKAQSALSEDPCAKTGGAIQWNNLFGKRVFDTFLGRIELGGPAIVPAINTEWLACQIAKIGFGVTSVILDFIAWVARNLLTVFMEAAVTIQMAFNNVLAGVLKFVANLDPFSRDVGIVVWRTLRDLAYIVLVFSALYAGFIWLFEGKGAAFSLIFNIILVALIINFSYAFVKLVFTIAFQIEDGISGGTKADFGKFILAALWQGNFIGSWHSKLNENWLVKEEPISSSSPILGALDFDQNFINFFISQLAQKIVVHILRIASTFAVLLMPLMIAMVISGALAMMIFLFMYRFITIIRLLITSPLAILSLAYPNKGPLGKYLPQFPFTFDNWLSEIVKWAVVIPIFMFMVVLGVVFQQNFVSMSQADVKMEDFIFVFIFLLFWFVFSFNVASGLSGVSAGIAKAAAAFPGWALGKLAWGIAQRFGIARWGGEGLKGVGKFLEEKVSSVPVLKQLAGWQIRSFGKRLQDLGDKVMEKDYLVRNRPRVVEDMKNLWKEFTKNPNPKTWKNFSDYVGGIAKMSAFKEDVQKFIEGLQREPSRLSLILQHDTNNDFLKIEPVGEKIDDVFNRLKTAITDYDKPSGQDAFVEFLERSSVDKIKAAFIGLLPNRWPVLERLLSDTRNRIITRDVAPKLVEVVFSIFMTTPEVTNRNQLARWILENRETLARMLTGKRDAEALLQEAVNTFQNQGINP